MKFRIKSDDPLNVLTSTKRVLENAKFVEINPTALDEISKTVSKRIEAGLDEASATIDVSRNTTSNVQLNFIEDAVNFCFWAEKDKEKWMVEWPKGTLIKGGWYALLGSFERALSKSDDILNANYLKDLTKDDVAELFRSANGSGIPLIDRRLENLQEAGRVLSSKYDGEFENLVKESDFDATRIIEKIIKDFSSFRDVAKLDGENVYFLKRAQIVANDLSYIYGSKISNVDLLTAFADYKLPQIFRSFGVINYSDDLASRVDAYTLIPAGSREEIEIRSATVWVVELIRQKLGIYTSGQIDNSIWLISQDQSKQEKPYHRTYTIYY